MTIFLSFISCSTNPRKSIATSELDGRVNIIEEYQPDNDGSEEGHEIQNAPKPNVYLDFSYYLGENRRLLPDSANGTHIIDGVHAR